MTTLSIVIVTYNPGDILLACLQSLPMGVGNYTYEVIVVDNASQDGIVQKASEQFPSVRFILNTDNRGFAGGNNQGLAEATGRYLLLLNPDVVVEPGSLSQLIDFLEEHSEAGIVGPRTFGRHGEITLTAFAPYNALTILWQYIGLDRIFPNWVYGRYRRASQTATEPFPVAWVQGCCLIIKRAVYEQIGGLDEKLFLFSEEPDYCQRAEKEGWKTYYLPSAQITHYESTVVSRYNERRIRHYHLSPMYYFRKRKQHLQVFALKIGFSFEMLLKVLIRLFQRLRGSDTGGYLVIYWKVLREVWRY